MQRMCKSCGKWHDLDKPWPEKCFGRRNASAHYVISDTMEPTKHHGTGRMIDSKRAFSKETRAIGCVELGNEAIKPRVPIPLDRGQRRDAIRKTLYDLRNR